jgi:hypothetical protein
MFLKISKSILLPLILSAAHETMRKWICRQYASALTYRLCTNAMDTRLFTGQSHSQINPPVFIGSSKMRPNRRWELTRGKVTPSIQIFESLPAHLTAWPAQIGLIKLSTSRGKSQKDSSPDCQRGELHEREVWDYPMIARDGCRRSSQYQHRHSYCSHPHPRRLW